MERRALLAGKTLRFCFIGAGSIGSLFGGYIANIKHSNIDVEVTFLCREKHARAIKLKGLNIISDDTQLAVSNIRALSSVDELKALLLRDEDFYFDYVVFCVKTVDLSTVLQQYEFINRRTHWMVILQNGIGNEDAFRSYFEKERIIRIVTSHGALLEDFGRVRHTGKGFTKIGAPYILECSPEGQNGLQKGLKNLKSLLDSAGLETDIADDIVLWIWEKAIVNIGINPLGALTRLNNGDLLKNPELRRLMKHAVIEAVKIAQSEGIDLDQERCIKMTHETARKTKDNINSMLQDILKKKRTEIDFMNGKIVELAESSGIEVPINKLLTMLIKGLETSQY
jgi:2-dehydropantoate 2-reductase